MDSTLDIVKYLVEKGANLNAKNRERKTPLYLARYNSPDIANYLESKGARYRRSIENDNSAIEDNKQTTSGASKPSSWINNLFAWVKDSVVGLLGSRVALSRMQSLPKESTSNSKPKVTMSRADLSQVDVDGTILLLDTFIRKFTGQKHISSNTRDITEQEASGYVLSITENFRKVVEQAALKNDISIHRLDIDFVKVQEEVTRKITGGKFSEIAEILNSYVEKACPSKETGCPGKLSLKKFDKFMAEFNKGLDVTLGQLMQQVLSRNSILKTSNVKEQQISLEPRSYLNDTSVQVHLTQTKGLRNQGKALIP